MIWSRIAPWLRLAIVSVVLILTAVSAVHQVVAEKGPATLPLGSIIAVRLDEAVSGKTHPPGTAVKASVARDVVVDSVLIIRIGTPVEASVASSSKAGAVGQAGNVSIDFESTQTVDGQTVFVRGVFSAQGQEKTGTSVGVGVVLCPLALLMKGEEGQLTSGMEFHTKTQNVVTIQPRP